MYYILEARFGMSAISACFTTRASTGPAVIDTATVGGNRYRRTLDCSGLIKLARAFRATEDHKFGGWLYNSQIWLIKIRKVS